jgi:hypothetical protein
MFIMGVIWKEKIGVGPKNELNVNLIYSPGRAQE